MKSIGVFFENQEVGKLGFDESTEKSIFQYNPKFLENGNFKSIFPFVLKKTPTSQIFNQFKGETFKSLPPMFADSLPDIFGNMVFKEWMKANNKKNVSPIEQLAYVGVRGMGAIEYKPSKLVDNDFTSDVDIEEMAELSKRILDVRAELRSDGLSHQSLLNMFRIGTSAGGARPKILVSEHKITGRLIPGDQNYSNEYYHYLIKLSIEESYSPEIIEYCYYRLATSLGIRMQPSKLIDGKHFCTERFDRVDGEKVHILTASGITGWDFKNPQYSSYENLFKLCNELVLPHAQIEELFKRMVLNVIFLNTDDHLKNTSFVYDNSTDRWNLSPAYDITFALNPLLNVRNVNRALSINGKRNDITIQDLLQLASDFSVKNAKNIIDNTIHAFDDLKIEMEKNTVPMRVLNALIDSIEQNIDNIQTSHEKRNSKRRKR